MKALARAHRWQGMLEGGEHLDRGAGKSGEDQPLLPGAVLRLTLLAPEIVESVLDGRHDPEQITLYRLMRPFRRCGANSCRASDRPLSAQERK